MGADSLLVGLPRLFAVAVPAQSVWDSLETIVSGVMVAIVAFWLARHRFKTERWHERRGEAYGKLNGLLYLIERSTRRLCEVENQDDPHLPARFSPTELQSFAEKRNVAHDQLGETFEEHRYLLSRSAIRILERYVEGIEGLWQSDTHAPNSWWDSCAKPAYRDFREVYQVDVGPELGLAWRVRRMARAIRHGFWRIRSNAYSARYRLRLWLEDQKLRFGTQLTQADVRTPPRYSHFLTVERMKNLGWSKPLIQRKLREQLRADPPPWDTPQEPLPPGPKRK